MTQIQSLASSAPLVASSAVAQAVLHTLLDQAEKLDRRRLPRVTISPSRHAAYFSPETAAPRKEANDAVMALERAGVLRLRWERHNEGNWLDWVELSPQGAEALYGLLGRTPQQDHDVALNMLLRQQNPVAGWFAAFLAWVEQQRQAGRSIAPLKGNDLRWDGDLLWALDAVTRLATPTLERHFSIRTFGDSKRWEEVKGSALTIVRRHDPSTAIFGDDDVALLEALNLERLPQHVPMAGPLQVRLGTAASDAVVDVGVFAPSVALASAMLRTVEIVSCAARAILTVENLASFSEMAALNPPFVVVYTGGFASPALIAFLASLCQACPHLPCFHWGDMDAGGLRILGHLRRHLGSVTPIAMEPATLEEYHHFGRPLTPGDQAALTLLRHDSTLNDCLGLIKAMGERGYKVEQEAVAAEQIMYLMDQALSM